MKLFFVPDAVPATGGNLSTGTSDSTPADTHTRHKGNVPDKAADLFNVSQNVAAKWKASSFVTLVWKTQGEFESDSVKFGTILNSRLQTGGNREYMTNDLENLDHKIDDAIPDMKTRINYKFGAKDGKSHFASFGINHTAHGGYEFPHDRQGRKASLQLMVDASNAAGFTDGEYNIDFWKKIQEDYTNALSKAGTTSGDVSGYVGDLNTLRTSLRRVLHSILLLLEANYPDTFDQVRREWGFQKENY